MSATAAVPANSFQRHEALREANRVKRQRYRLQVDAKQAMVVDGLPAARALVADALVECPEWLAAADALDVLRWAPRVGPREADRLYALMGLQGRYRVGELTPRCRAVLADGLRVSEWVGR